MVPALIALRPNSAPMTVAPIETAVWHFLAGRLLLLARDALFGPAQLLFQRRPLGGELLAHALDLGVARLALRALHADAEVALRLADLRGQLKRSVPPELERLRAWRPMRRTTSARRHSSSPSPPPSAAARTWRRPRRLVARVAGATSRTSAPVQSTATAPSPIGAAATMSLVSLILQLRVRVVHARGAERHRAGSVAGSPRPARRAA